MTASALTSSRSFGKIASTSDWPCLGCRASGPDGLGPLSPLSGDLGEILGEGLLHIRAPVAWRLQLPVLCPQVGAIPPAFGAGGSIHNLAVAIPRLCGGHHLSLRCLRRPFLPRRGGWGSSGCGCGGCRARSAGSLPPAVSIRENPLRCHWPPHPGAVQSPPPESRGRATCSRSGRGLSAAG